MCGKIVANRIAADDNPMMLMSIAMKPVSTPPFPLERIKEMTNLMGGNGALKHFESAACTERHFFCHFGGEPHDLRLPRRLHRLLRGRQRYPGSAVGGGEGSSERRMRTDIGAPIDDAGGGRIFLFCSLPIPAVK